MPAVEYREPLILGPWNSKSAGTQVFPRCIQKLSEVQGLPHIENRAVRTPSKSKPLRILDFHIRVGTKRRLQVYPGLQKNIASIRNFKNGTDQDGRQPKEPHSYLALGEGNSIVYGHPYFQQPLKGLGRQSD